MTAFRDFPIRRKLMVVTLLGAAGAVFLAGTLGIVYEFLHFRGEIVRNMTFEADIIGEASAAALAFEDLDTARENLAALGVRPEIMTARLFRTDGTVFTEYLRAGIDTARFPADPPVNAPILRTDRLRVCRPVRLEGDKVGTICMWVELSEPRQRLRRYALIVLGVMVVSVVGSLIVGHRLQRVISDPLLALTNVMREVGQRRDYSLRVTKNSADEIGALTDGFNHMLAQIQQHEQLLRSSEERFRQVAENIHEVFWMTDVAKSEMIYISAGYEEIWGRYVGDLYAQPQSWMDAVHPADRDRVREAALNKQANGEYDEEYRIVRPDGSLRWIRDRAFPVHGESGTIYRIAGIAEDITERKRAEEALRQSQEQLKAIMDNATAVIYLKDKQGRYLLINHQYETLFHVTREQIVGKADCDVFPKELAEAFRANDVKVLEAGSPLEFEEVAPQDDGLHTYISIKFPLLDATGVPYAVCGISTDITERKRLVEQLIQAEKMESVGRLAAGVAHEVKNPLMTLMMGVEYLTQIHDRHGETKSTLEEMRSAIERANSIIIGLLDFSAPKALRLESADVNAILDSSLRLVHHELTRHHIQLTRELAPDLPSLPLDKNKLEQVFVNLFMNAVQAMENGGGTLTVRTCALPPGGAKVEIDDTGPGIPEDKLLKVFDPFFTTKTPGKGTGLGLTVVKQIIALHEGAIAVRNRIEGGLRVTVEFNNLRRPQP